MSALFDRIARWFDEHLGPESGDGKAKYVVIGALALVIVLALALTFGPMLGTGATARPPREVRFRCTETGREHVLTAEEIARQEAETADSGEPFASMRFRNPETGRRTLVRMTQCPSCHKHFLPEWVEKSGPGKEAGGPAAAAAGSLICRHCGTDVHEWREGRR